MPAVHPGARPLLHRAAARELHHVFLEARPRCAPTSPTPTDRDRDPRVARPRVASRSSAPASSAARSASRSGVPAPTCAASTATPSARRRAHARGRGRRRVADRVADAVAGADLTVVAVPVGHVAEVVVEALDAGARAGHRRRLGEGAGRRRGRGAPAPTSRARFVGGHPMAGSEQEGLAGASADLFVGATWVLTPTGAHRPAGVRRRARAVVAALGAEAIAVAPELHDALVAVVSHVPQLAASTLMNVASARRRRARGRCCASPPAASAT